MKHNITLIVNGDAYQLAIDPWRTLNDVLREELNLTGTKKGFGTGDCGACTVMVGYRPQAGLTGPFPLEGKPASWM